MHADRSLNRLRPTLAIATSTCPRRGRGGRWERAGSRDADGNEIGFGGAQLE
jgi:hypothetical protein